jgi:DNA-binding transcriptional LysR family regulator
MLDYRDLVYFEAIAGSESLARAASQLGRTQPALTKCIHRLEDSVGAALFDRAGRGLKLTPVGVALLGQAKRLRSSMDNAVRELSDVAKGSAGHVRVGAGATMAEYLLPQVCGAFTAGSPGVTVEIQIAMNDVLRDALRAGEIDVLIGPVLTGEDQEFGVEVFGSDEVVVVAPRGHPLCGRPLEIKELSQYRWVLPAPSVAMRRWLDRVFEAHGLTGPNVQIETNSILLLPRLIAETALLSFTSTRNLGRGRVGEHLDRLDVDATTLQRQLGLVYRKDDYLSPASLRFIRVVAEMGEALLRKNATHPRSATAT